MFCDQWAWIQDKRSKRRIQFERYDCQRKASDMLVLGENLVCLKARQLGITWLLAVYCTWRLITQPMYTAFVVQQNRDYAKDFIRRVKFVYRWLPEFLKVPIKSDSRYELMFDHGESEESELRVLAGGESAGRSTTADLFVFDEHARIPDAKEAREGCEPAIEMAGGQLVSISTSMGPVGDFFTVWNDSPKNDYKRIFMPWSDHPLRDEKWYKSEILAHASNPFYMPREYPTTPEEAFQHAEGRCYPSLDAMRNVRGFKELRLEKEHADLYRAVDFGSVHAYCCLWIAHFADEHAGLTIDPGCINTLRQHMSYRFAPVRGQGFERPHKVDDDTCDALRYAVNHFNFTGHVHVYRELFVENSVSKGRTDMTDIADIQKMSGWVAGPAKSAQAYIPGETAEFYYGTVCDPSQPKTIELYSMNNIDACPFQRPTGSMMGRHVMDGIRRVATLIDGTMEILKRRDRSGEDEDMPRRNRGRHIKFSRGLQSTIDKEIKNEGGRRGRLSVFGPTTPPGTFNFH